jgi:short-subunit dehydrogenase
MNIINKIKSNLILKIITLIILLFVFVQILLVLIYFIYFFKKYFFTSELDLIDRYGINSWVLITGCSSGQGKNFAIEFAKRGFNIILVGSERIYNTNKIIKEKYNIKTHCIVLNFNDAYKKDFFNPIISVLNKLDGELSILVNNVGHRVAWKNYHNMPSQKINDSIICGTIVQARITQLAIQRFINRKTNKKSAIIDITSMCTYPNFWFGYKGEISIPYLSVYEGANAFGYFFSNSIYKEYGEYIDILNITPGAVITENTEYLKNIPFSVSSEQYIKNIFKLIGNYNGPQFADWHHDLSSILCNFMFFYKNIILKETGTIIANNYMNSYYS